MRGLVDRGLVERPPTARQAARGPSHQSGIDLISYLGGKTTAEALIEKNGVYVDVPNLKIMLLPQCRQRMVNFEDHVLASEAGSVFIGTECTCCVFGQRTSKPPSGLILGVTFLLVSGRRMMSSGTRLPTRISRRLLKARNWQALT